MRLSFLGDAEKLHFGIEKQHLILHTTKWISGIAIKNEREKLALR